MNGGEITISVKADYSEMERNLAEAEAKAGAVAETTAKTYNSKFGSYLDKSRNSITKKLEAFVNPLQMLDRVADFAETAGEKGFGTALENLVKSIPVAGAAYRVGSSIGTSLLNAFGAETEGQFVERIQKELAEAEKVAEKRRKEVEKIDKEAKQSFAVQQETSDLEFELAMKRMEKEGDAAQAIWERGWREREKLETELALKLADVEDKAQREILEKNYRAKIELVDAETRERAEAERAARESSKQQKADERQREIDDITKEWMDYLDDIDKAERDQQKDREKREKDAIDERKKAMEEVARMEEERVSSQAAGIQGVSTVLGTFTFDAYPDSDKRSNDERMVRAMEGLLANATTGGFV